MKLKVVIADDERLICDMLSQFINAEELQLELAGVAYDGEELFNKIVELGPDIVITDISMPKIDGIEIIRRVTQMEIKCKFIVISGYRQFDYAYNALKYDVVDYLLKPVDQAELNSALSKIAWQIRHDSDEFPSTLGQPVRNYFIHKGIKELKNSPKPLNEINSKYNTNFKEGCFQLLLMRMDYINRPKEIPNNANSLHNKVKNIMKQFLEKHCLELLVTNDWDDIIAILNYPEEEKEAIQESFKELFIQTKNVIELFGGLTATLCVGGVHMDVCELEISKGEATEAAWTRMSLGIGKIIYYNSSLKESSASLEAMIENLRKRVRTSFETLNRNEFTKCINELFALPNKVLSRHDIKSFVRNIPEMLFSIYEDKKSGIEDYEGQCKEVRYKMRMVTSFPECRQTMITQITQFMDRIKEFVDSLNTKPIRQAMDYVKLHYSQPISLEDVASEVGLSSVYFSSIFKKEMNQNFTDYLREYRLNIAKKLLSNSNMSIKEISSELGFEDARYFSKLFKKTVGIKPTEYRRIYS